MTYSGLFDVEHFIVYLVSWLSSQIYFSNFIGNVKYKIKDKKNTWFYVRQNSSNRPAPKMHKRFSFAN